MVFKDPHKLNPTLDLVLERIVDISPEQVFAAWTQPRYLKKWFAPAPWTTVVCEVDLRPGGVFHTVMRSPDGEEYPAGGCFLEIVENRKLVWTDALTAGYRPSENPFFTTILTLEPYGQGTKYNVRVVHKDQDHRKKHEEMGFQLGWSMCLDQLVAVMKSKTP